MRLRVALQHSDWSSERDDAGIVLRYNSATIPIRCHLQMSAPREPGMGLKTARGLRDGRGRSCRRGTWRVFSPIDLAMTR